MSVGIQKAKEPVLHGHDALFDPELDQKYKCPVCLVALRDPVQTKCGHRFCRNCLKHSRGKALYGKCPVDKSWFDPAHHVFEDNAVKREVLSLRIKCDNCNDGCDWRGELRDRKKHLSNCPDVKVPCTNSCGHVFNRRHSTTHLEVCPKRMEPCQKCGLLLVASELAKHQLFVCEKFPVTCPVCAETGILRENVSRHVDVAEGDCPLVVIKCPFSDIGCYFQDKRKNMAVHHQSASLHHMQLLMMKIQQQNEMILQQQAQLSDLTNTCRQLSQTNEEQVSMIAGQATLIQLQAACIRELENGDANNGRLLWRVSIPAVKNSTLLSPSFNTHCHGYKVRLVLDTTDVEGASLYVEMLVSNQNDFDGECHVTIFDQSRQLDTFKLSFPLNFRAKNSQTKQHGIFKFMPIDDLFSAPFARADSVLILAEIKPKLDNR